MCFGFHALGHDLDIEFACDAGDRPHDRGIAGVFRGGLHHCLGDLEPADAVGPQIVERGKGYCAHQRTVADQEQEDVAKPLRYARPSLPQQDRWQTQAFVEDLGGGRIVGTCVPPPISV